MVDFILDVWHHLTQPDLLGQWVALLGPWLYVLLEILTSALHFTSRVSIARRSPSESTSSSIFLNSSLTAPDVAEPASKPCVAQSRIDGNRGIKRGDCFGGTIFGGEQKSVQSVGLGVARRELHCFALHQLRRQMTGHDCKLFLFVRE